MKVNKETVVDFVKVVRKSFSPDELEENNAYYLDDATVILTSDNRLVGIYFETLGQSFSVLSTLDLILATGDEEDDAYVVDDETMIELIEEYLVWRTKVVQTLEA